MEQGIGHTEESVRNNFMTNEDFARYLDIEYLRKNRLMLHFFGLGFIQLKLSDKERLHFYSALLPAFVETPHTHRYSFLSTVLFGEIENTVYREVAGDQFVVSYEDCREGTGSSTEWPTRLAGFEVERVETIRTYDSYSMEPDQFHTVRAKGCITLLRRGEVCRERAMVTTTWGQESICPFSRKVAEVDLWEIIALMLEEAKKYMEEI